MLRKIFSLIIILFACSCAEREEKVVLLSSLEIDNYLGEDCYTVSKNGSINISIENAPLFTKMKNNEGESFTYEQYANLIAVLLDRAVSAPESDSIKVIINDSTVRKEFTYSIEYLHNVDRRISVALDFAAAIKSKDYNKAKQLLNENMLREKSDEELNKFFSNVFDHGNIVYAFPIHYRTNDQVLGLYMNYLYTDKRIIHTYIFVFLLDKDSKIYGIQTF